MKTVYGKDGKDKKVITMKDFEEHLESGFYFSSAKERDEAVAAEAEADKPAKPAAKKPGPKPKADVE